jgi:thymidine kinase
MALPHLPHHQGWIEVVVGPMFSGKSEELIRRVKRALIARQRVLVFKPRLDDRYHAADVMSHDGKRAEAIPVQDSADLRKHLNLTDPLPEGRVAPRAMAASPLPDVVAVDEAQFFDAGLVPTLLELADKGVRVICAGLDMDFRGEPFGIMPELLSRAEYVEKLYAVCPVCGAPATRTQRFVNGKPARRDDPIILVGASEAYEPRCRKCHTVVGQEVQAIL